MEEGREWDCGYDYRTVFTALKAGLAAALILLATGAFGGDDAAQKQKELETLRARIATVNDGLTRDRQARDRLAVQIETAEQRIAGLGVQVQKLKSEVRAQDERLRRTAEERQRAERALAQQKRAFGRQLRAAYAIGERSQIKMMLNLDSAARLSRTATYFDLLNRHRRQQIESVRDEAAALDAVLERQRQEGEQLTALVRKRESALADLQARRGERQGLLAELGRRIAGATGDVERLRAQENDLLRLLESLREALADIPFDLGNGTPFAQLKGKLPWPIKGKLLARFGDAKAGGRLKWNGLWIGGAEGSAVRAVARGRVAYVGWMHRYGLIAVLEHEGGYYSLYGHNQSVGVSTGEWIEAGAGVATLGATGGHSRPGLYFELRKGSVAVNPKEWLRK